MSSCNVLIIRSEKQATALSEKMRMQGIASCVFPALEIVDPPDLKATGLQLTQLAHYDGLIFCTANAVEKSVSLIPECVAEINQSSAQVLAIGPSTALALERAGIQVDAIPQYDYSSEGLLALPELQAVNQKRMAIIAGVGGRPLLEDTLVARGAWVTKIDTYRRRCPDVKDFPSQLLTWQESGVDTVVGSSFSSLENLYQLTPEASRVWLLSRQIVVVSQRMQEKASALGFSHFLLADNATDEAILKVLL